MGKILQQPTIVGQLPISTYTVILLGFRIEDFDKDSVVETLHRASSRLIKTFPFLAGQVVLEGKDDSTTTGIYRTIPYEPHSESFVHVKDCSGVCPSLDELVAAKAPISMLDGNILSPKRGFFHMYDPTQELLPVFNIQANFIEGGLILCFAAEHNCLDMNGQGQAIRLFAASCGDSHQPFSDAHVAAGNLDSSSVFPFLKDDEKPLEHLEMRVPSSLGQVPPTPTSAVAAPWTVFRLSRSSIAQLKLEASQHPATDIAWISSNDTITAFFWQRLTLARLSRFPDVKECSLIRVFDARRLLKLPTPEAFMGHCILICPTTTLLETLKSASLALLAQDLRRSILKIDDYYLRSLVTTIRDTKDRSTLSYGAGLKSGLDMLTSSFAGLGIQHCEFGPLLGRAVFARRPQLDEAEGVSYLMPKTIDGDIDLEASLRLDDVEALNNDPVWTKHVEFIG